MFGTNILGFGHYTDDNLITNDDLAKIVETSDEWISSRTGIKSRYIATSNTSDLATNAALKALSDSGVDKSEIELIVVATFTPDNQTPSVASIVQKNLELTGNVTAFDLNAACTGFIYATNVASALIKSGQYKKALVIGAETISKTLDWSDRTTCVLFGDGAGAVVLGQTDHDEFIECYTRSKPDVDDVLLAKGHRNTSPYFDDENESHHLSMNGQAVFKFAVSVVGDAVKNVLKQANLTIDDIDYVVPHQANQRIIEFVAKQLKTDKEKFYLNIAEYGNTSAASIPIALSEMKQKGLLDQDKKIIMVGFGAGLTWGASYIDYKVK
jgi:3-oxoacyl-[acyl-carrier-protein] synthase-3